MHEAPPTFGHVFLVQESVSSRGLQRPQRSAPLALIHPSSTEEKHVSKRVEDGPSDRTHVTKWPVGQPTGHRKGHAGKAQARPQTYLARWPDSQTPCLITWWDEPPTTGKNPLQTVKVYVGSRIKLACVFGTHLVRLLSLENKPLLA